LEVIEMKKVTKKWRGWLYDYAKSSAKLRELMAVSPPQDLPPSSSPEVRNAPKKKTDATTLERTEPYESFDSVSDSQSSVSEENTPMLQDADPLEKRFPSGEEEPLPKI